MPGHSVQFSVHGHLSVDQGSTNGSKLVFHMSQVMRKCVLCHMRTTKAQISMRIRGLISSFVVRSSDSIISLVSRSEISRFYLVSVAEQAGLNVTRSQTLEDTFSLDGAHTRVY